MLPQQQAAIYTETGVTAGGAVAMTPLPSLTATGAQAALSLSI